MILQVEKILFRRINSEEKWASEMKPHELVLIFSAVNKNCVSFTGCFDSISTKRDIQLFFAVNVY